MKKHNFFAGPAILPSSVIQQAANAAVDFNGMGLSLLEISHRSKEFMEVLDESITLVKGLLGAGDNFEVLFLTGGASSQFFMTAMNLLDENETAAYIDTGTWSTKAIKEAKNFGNVQIVASSNDKQYTYIPKTYDIPAEAKYLHYTSNNTIYGTQFQDLPKTKLPLVCDMSSDIFSKQIDINRYGLIYAGAQKNLGPAGTTLVVVRKDMLNKVQRTIPIILDYNTHIKKNSSFNTPPVFPIYVCMLTMRWINELGGLNAMVERNEKKAGLLYDEIDNNPLFYGTAEKEDRSLMNVTFLQKDSGLDSAFIEACTLAGCLGVKGHRSVGGFRASIYNAMPIESVQVLVDVMKNFAKKYA